ncbi:hypothetical protein HAX54_022919 [Datura stramonium]|uniref:Uncharacterized protein n=1 Tax=Datura stramonium TaxID=4076 RepID=A0ABS8UXM0_DATST|nr:hypothetical protein [Datura stramonium]
MNKKVLRVHKLTEMEGELKPMDAEQLREYGHKMVDFIADYYKNIENFPVLSQVQFQKWGPFSSPTKADPIIQRMPKSLENVAQIEDPVNIEIQANTSKEGRTYLQTQSSATMQIAKIATMPEGHKQLAEIQNYQIIKSMTETAAPV